MTYPGSTGILSAGATPKVTEQSETIAIYNLMPMTMQRNYIAMHIDSHKLLVIGLSLFLRLTRNCEADEENEIR